MGNDCCCTSSKEEVTKMTDIELQVEKRTTRKECCTNTSFGIIYILATGSMVIVVVTGGPLTLIISAVISGCLGIYYIGEFICNYQQIEGINREIKRREDAEVNIIDIGKVVISSKKFL